VIRPSTWLPLAVLALLVGLTLWLDNLVQPAPVRSDGKDRHDPDLIVENFRANKLGEDGRVLYTLTARKMVHYPDDESALLERLSFEAQQPKQPKVAITSDAGRLLEGGDKVWFEGNVVLVRDADIRVAASRLTTDRLLVLPEEGIARTASAVVLENEDGRVEATGLEMNNQSRTARLDRVRATYKPPQR
jgi:lipopolysaccharide export system protein LptC